MKQIVAALVCFFGSWGTLVFVNTLVFCILFTMHPSDPDYFLHRLYMGNINMALLIPSFFITKYILSKDEQTIF